MVDHDRKKKKKTDNEYMFNYYNFLLFILMRKSLNESGLIGLGQTYHHIESTTLQNNQFLIN